MDSGTSQFASTSASFIPPPPTSLTKEAASLSVPDSPATDPISRIDLGIIVQAASSCFDSLRKSVAEISNERKFQYLTSHSKPSIGDAVHTHPVIYKRWKELDCFFSTKVVTSISLVIIQWHFSRWHMSLLHSFS